MTPLRPSPSRLTDGRGRGLEGGGRVATRAHRAHAGATVRGRSGRRGRTEETGLTGSSLRRVRVYMVPPGAGLRGGYARRRGAGAGRGKRRPAGVGALKRGDPGLDERSFSSTGRTTLRARPRLPSLRFLPSTFLSPFGRLSLRVFASLPSFRLRTSGCSRL